MQKMQKERCKGGCALSSGLYNYSVSLFDFIWSADASPDGRHIRSIIRR